MLHTHFSNRFEALSALLLNQLSAPAADGLAGVFRAKQIIVPSLAMRRALTLEMARSQGVCAHVRFDFLAQWLWARLSRLSGAPGSHADPPFAAQPLGWRVFEAFNDVDFVASQPRLAAYLHGADRLMHYELACRSAELLEQYSTYRADGLEHWAEGRPWAEHAGAEPEDAAWQAALWRRLRLALAARFSADGHTPPDPLARSALQALQPRPAAAPVHIFALPTMPPLHLQWLQQLAQHDELHLYVLNPCSEHWFDLVGPRRLAQLTARGQAQGFEVGNRLLAAWGQQTQAHLGALVDASGSATTEESLALYLPAPGTSLLAQVQNAVLELRELAPASLVLAAGDRSIEVHACHSMTRQLEVLHSHLLGLFADAEARGEALPPGRVLVAVPDLEAAAPLVDAVFGTQPREQSIPYTLTGRQRSRNDAPAQAVLDLLALVGSRWSASDVLALLQQPLVARRFGLDEVELQALQSWLADSGTHWGHDAAHRAQLGLPADAAHTWEDGLARLFLAYALPMDPGSEALPPWAGLLPAGRPEGLQAQALGSLWAFITALGDLQAQTAQPLPPGEWAALLQQCLPRFLLTDAGDSAGASATDSALVAMQAAIGELAANWQSAELSTPLPLAVVREALQRQLDDSAPGGVPGGAVTFAAMASLRGLPYDVVCVLGLDDGVYPSSTRAVEFDLMAAHPRRGDRQRRLDERNVFLDLLLAARHSVFLAYTGRSLRDNTPLAPSVLVDELLDTLSTAMLADPAQAADASALARARQRLWVEHPLQPFSPQAFSASSDLRLRSRDAELARALQASLRQAPLQFQVTVPQLGPLETDDQGDDDDGDGFDPRPRFFTQPLPAQQAIHTRERVLSLQQLQQFFRHPCRQLLRQRLGIVLSRGPESLRDEERFVPDAKARRELAALLLPALMGGVSPGDALALAQASGAWPSGALGAASLSAELQGLGEFAARVRKASAGALLPPLLVRHDLPSDGVAWRLEAGFADLRASGLLRWRHGTAQPADLLDAWLQHLLLCLGLQHSARQDAAACTTWLATDGDWLFRPVADAGAQLAALLPLVDQGLREPLHFYPRAAWAWVDKPLSPGAAYQAWQPTPHKPWAEGADAHYRLALRGVAEPLDGTFQQLAHAVFDPLIEHLVRPSAAPALPHHVAAR